RSRYLEADVGITGANFLVAETGSNIIVTNEGNGDLSCTLPRVHVVTASIDKVVPTLDDASALLRLLARSATGQEITSYTTFSSGPKRAGDPDGPDEYHVVLLDNGRTEMLAGAFRDMLRCIRCGACMNHCPVYGVIGGHSYGWVYPGPMGSVLTPNFLGLDEAGDLANACTLNGHCASVCPVKIPLPDLLREHRRRQFERKLQPRFARFALAAWAAIARHPRLYQPLMSMGIRILNRLGRGKGRFKSLPMLGAWTRTRDLPAPQSQTFQSLRKKQRRQER
ncbi:MAG: lactate utilization protein, partial [Gammaproteobacteria bacterium]|nr:lactate utilization protein [Gammaproteobacteria bacterium]